MDSILLEDGSRVGVKACEEVDRMVYDAESEQMLHPSLIASIDPNLAIHREAKLRLHFLSVQAKRTKRYRLKIAKRIPEELLRSNDITIPPHHYRTPCKRFKPNILDTEDEEAGKHSIDLLKKLAMDKIDKDASKLNKNRFKRLAEFLILRLDSFQDITELSNEIFLFCCTVYFRKAFEFKHLKLLMRALYKDFGSRNTL